MRVHRDRTYDRSCSFVSFLRARTHTPHTPHTPHTHTRAHVYIDLPSTRTRRSRAVGEMQRRCACRRVRVREGRVGFACRVRVAEPLRIGIPERNTNKQTKTMADERGRERGKEEGWEGEAETPHAHRTERALAFTDNAAHSKPRNRHSHTLTHSHNNNNKERNVVALYLRVFPSLAGEEIGETL